MNSARSQITLQGQLDHITYYNEDNHYTIARLKTEGAQTYMTLVGYLAGVGKKIYHGYVRRQIQRSALASCGYIQARPMMSVHG